MFKTISGSKLADCSRAVFSRFEFLARKTELIVRKSAKFSADGFVLGIFKSVITGRAQQSLPLRTAARTSDKTGGLKTG